MLSEQAADVRRVDLAEISEGGVGLEGAMMRGRGFSQAFMRGLDKATGFSVVVITVLGLVNSVMRSIFAQPMAWVQVVYSLTLVEVAYLAVGGRTSEKNKLTMTAPCRFFEQKIQYMVLAIRSTLPVCIFNYILFYCWGVITGNDNFESTIQTLGFPLCIAFPASPVTFASISAARIFDSLAQQAEGYAVVKIEEGVS